MAGLINPQMGLYFICLEFFNNTVEVAYFFVQFYKWKKQFTLDIMNV